jgi:hypothetical protein
MAGEAMPPGEWLQLQQRNDGAILPPAHLWGFGGLHGGLTLALLTQAMQQGGDDHGVFRSATARLYRPITDAFTTTVSRPRPGRDTADAISQGPLRRRWSPAWPGRLRFRRSHRAALRHRPLLSASASSSHPSSCRSRRLWRSGRSGPTGPTAAAHSRS